MSKRKAKNQVSISPLSYGEWPPRPVLHKKDFVERYKRGEFGNASPTWHSIEEWLDWVDSLPNPLALLGCSMPLSSLGNFHIRNRIAQGVTWYNVPADQLDIVWDIAMHRVGAENLYISAMAPHDKNLIQGEVWQNTEHLWLTYSTMVGNPMRDVLREEPRHATGLNAARILRHYLCPNSWEWLNQLLDNYPSHVIEFSTFSVEWGTIPHYNTVWWEIRNY